MAQNQPNRLRLNELTHYLVARVPPEQLGATKLNKLLWFIDCTSYRELGRSLTGLSSYARRKYGPTPRRMPQVLRELKAAGQITEFSAETAIGHLRREFHSLAEPPVNEFASEEVDLINRVIIEYISMSAAEVSDISHDTLWEETALGEDIPLDEAAFPPSELADADLDWASSEVARLQL